MTQSPTTTPPPPESQLPTSSTGPITPPPKDITTNAPDSLPREGKLANSGYRTSGLDAARRMVREDIDHVVLLPLEVLWKIPLAYDVDRIRQHITKQGWLLDDRWNPQRISRTNLDSRSGLLEWDAFRPLADLFNEILTYPPAATVRKDVRCMVHAGWAAPKSDRISKHRPDAFLLMNSSLEVNPSDASEIKIPDTIHWRDITCPFEYKFGDGDKKDVGLSVRTFSSWFPASDRVL